MQCIHLSCFELEANVVKRLLELVRIREADRLEFCGCAVSILGFQVFSGNDLPILMPASFTSFTGDNES